MPFVPTISGTAVPRMQPGVRIDPGALQSTGRANAALGAAVSQTANVLAGIAAQRQTHIDRGLLAGEDNIRRKTVAEIQTYTENNQDKPEAWGKFHDSTWKAYEDGRNARAKTWGKRVLEEDNLRLNDFKTEATIRFSTAQNGALIRQANARIEANADDRMRNGDVTGALQSIGQMNLRPEMRVAKVEQVTNAAVYHGFDRRLSDIAELTPVEQMKELASVEAELTTQKNGRYEFGNVADDDGKVVGGLGEQGRIDLIRQTRARKNAAMSEMAQTGRSLVRKVADGFAPELVFSEAMKAGQISEDVARIFLPEVDMALRQKAEKEAEKAEKEAERIATKRDKAETGALIDINRRSGATLTLEDIERRQALGVTRPNDPNALTAGAADRLRAELQAVEAEDVRSLDYTSIEDDLLNRLGQGLIPTFIKDFGQMTDGVRALKLDAINRAKISKGAKLKLLDLFFEVQAWDLRDSEISEKDGDRDITPEEKDVRSSLIGTYRNLRSALSPRAIGARYMEDMNQIGEWFRKNPDAAPSVRAAKAKEFYEQASRSTADAAAISLLSTVFE